MPADTPPSPAIAIRPVINATQDDRDLAGYEDRLARPTDVKAAELQDGGRLRHVIFSRQFTVDLLADLAASADR
ncbi:MAG: hypothetical protein AAGG46_06875, partial [Planctomycetota bacterium]